MWENRSRLIFITCILLSGALFVQMGMYLLHLISGWNVRYNLIELCHSVVGHYMGYVLNMLVFHAFVYSVWFCIRQLFLSSRFYNGMLEHRDEALTKELNRKFPEGRHRITVIQTASPMAFAMGLIKPRIVVSTGLIEMLDARELQAVIYHERFHQMHGDPLKTFILSLMSAVMWYIPILKLLRHNYRIIREVLADKYAIGQQGASVYLGSALLKLLQAKGSGPQILSHVSFADTSVNFRIRHLLEPQSELPLRWPFTTAVISVQVLFILCAMFVFVLH